MRRSAEREAKLEEIRSRRSHVHGSYGFGSSTPRLAERAQSHGSLLNKSTSQTPNVTSIHDMSTSQTALSTSLHVPTQRRATSALSLNNRRSYDGRPATGNPPTDNTTGGATCCEHKGWCWCCFILGGVLSRKVLVVVMGKVPAIVAGKFYLSLSCSLPNARNSTKGLLFQLLSYI